MVTTLKREEIGDILSVRHICTYMTLCIMLRELIILYRTIDVLFRLRLARLGRVGSGSINIICITVSESFNPYVPHLKVPNAYLYVQLPYQLYNLCWSSR